MGGTSRTTGQTQLLAVASKKFQDILSGFPTEHAALYAREFVDLLNKKLEEGTLTDVGSARDADEMIDTAFPQNVSWQSTVTDEQGRRISHGNTKAAASGR